MNRLARLLSPLVLLCVLAACAKPAVPTAPAAATSAPKPAEAAQAPELFLARPEGARGPLVAYDMASGLQRFTLPAGLMAADEKSFFTAAVTGDKIYVMGGTDGTQTLAVTEAYVPEAEARGENPWQTRAPLPAGRLRMGVVSVAGIVHVMGGEGSPQLSPLIYDEKANQWQPFQAPNLPPVSKVSLAVESGNIHLLGGQIAAAPSRQHIVYQAIYVIQLPLLSP